MSYRSFKRVLGETHLERKCHFLFGGCLLLLITASFWWYGLRTERLVRDVNRKAGEDYAVSSLLKHHWVHLNKDKKYSKIFPEHASQPQYHGLFGEIIAGIEGKQEYSWEVLTDKKGNDEPPLVPESNPSMQIQLPNNDWERKHIPILKQKLDRLLAEEAKQLEQSEDAPPVESSDDLQSSLALLSKTLIFDERWDHENKQYHYYQAVHWKASCIGPCHGSSANPGPTSIPRDVFTEAPPFRAIKVNIPTSETQKAINKNRAILLATAIVTVVVAMIAMYVIVRYVIVKPLKHLRDVSDEISRGNIDSRADIHTNDEFEELAVAFNRMMRGLVDAQNQQRELNYDLDHKVDQLAQANMQLYEMNRLKGDFLANMSHELRTPLNSILGFSDVLLGIKALNDKQRRYVQNIQKSGRLLLDMINDTLDLAKMESGRMEVRLSEFPVGVVVRAQCDLVRSLTEEKNIDLEVQVDDDLPPVYQDQSKVQQILTNLLSNAIKFTPEGGRIVVSGKNDPDDRLILTVSDTGVGIAEEDREIIFEKFRQGSGVGPDNLTRAYSGTGLGLSIVKELCKLLGGDVSFKSDVGKGSTFTVRLPWRRPDDPPRETKLAARLDELTKTQRLEFVRPAETTTSHKSTDASDSSQPLTEV